MKAVVAAFNQEKALVGAFSVITNLQMQFRCNFLKHHLELTVSPHEAGRGEEAEGVGRVLPDLVPLPHLHRLRHLHLLGVQRQVHLVQLRGGPRLVVEEVVVGVPVVPGGALQRVIVLGEGGGRQLRGRALDQLQPGVGQTRLGRGAAPASKDIRLY